ncbi:carboxymuconolactone decarboxylase family protein [Marinovum sp.]|uniref:carboxymuconolactone decarboxylase family protein n=1 Tax=Marinovum sp. TaxID=2024839 RepID=UPI002B26F956|nr:carboxymuconolactone decarboxylase family protein [Marinovum sp.]
MTDFTLHTQDTAPEDAKPLLAQSQSAFGFIPGLHAVMAESPELLEAYQRVHALFAKSSFTAEELTVVWQTVNVENACHYCVPAHTGIAKSMKVDDAITDALRDGTPLPDARLEALRSFTLHLVRQHGTLDEAQVQTFLDAGFTRRNILEVILGYSQKIMSNYTNHLADTPVDTVFEKFAWAPADKAA